MAVLRPSGVRARTVVALARLCGAAVAVAVVAGGAAPAAHAQAGLGGGTEFRTGAVFPFVAGTPGTIETGMYVQNIGDDVAEVELRGELPAGIVLEPLVPTPLVLRPGELGQFPFLVTVSDAVAPGRYELIINLAQTNVGRRDGPTGSVYTPAIAGSFVVEVVGASAAVTIAPVSDATGLPATGRISLFYLTGQATPLLIDATDGTRLTRDVVPGRYRATFDVPGLQRQELEFEIAAGEDRVVRMEIPTLSFSFVGATPTLDADGDIVTAELVASVNNSLRRVDGPITFGVEVLRDGTLIEDINLAVVPELPPGRSEQRASYRPLEGFSGGEWEFVFVLSSDEFRLEATERPSFTAPGLLQSNWEYVALAGAAVLILLLAAPRRWWIALGRRRRTEEEVVDVASS